MKYRRVVNIFIDGRRTSISLSDVQYIAAKRMASEHQMDLNSYFVNLIKAIQKKQNGSMSNAVRDGIIVDLIGRWMS